MLMFTRVFLRILILTTLATFLISMTVLTFMVSSKLVTCVVYIVLILLFILSREQNFLWCELTYVASYQEIKDYIA